MEIEQFVNQSEGNWTAMRSGHSLAFKQFEQIQSKIRIKILNAESPKILEILNSYKEIDGELVTPFKIS